MDGPIRETRFVNILILSVFGLLLATVHLLAITRIAVLRVTDWK